MSTLRTNTLKTLDDLTTLNLPDIVVKAFLSASDGASKIGYGPLTVESALNQSYSVDNAGAIGNGIADDTAAIQAAINTGRKYIVFNSGKTYNVTALTVPGNDVTLALLGNAKIQGTVATNKVITISGNNCNVIGTGTISGPAVFDGANVQPTYGLLWVTGNYCTVQGITFDTIPKEGIVFSESQGHKVYGCRFIGRFPYASYNEASTTNHCGIIYDTPPLATDPKPFLTIVGNSFETCIQGCLMLNYGAASNNTGVTIVGNTFRNCWDHGVYMSRGKGHNISSNVFLSVRRPIVSDGIGSVVDGNVLYSAETGVSNAEQTISVREASQSVISNNTIYGVDASILVDCLETDDANENRIVDNVIYATGRVFASCGIRLGTNAANCRNNVVANNTISLTALGTNGPGIELSMRVGSFATGTVVKDNTIIRTDVGHGIIADRHNYVTIAGNTMSFSGSAGGATPVTLISVTNSSFPIIELNKMRYLTGGTNVTVTGIISGAGCAIPKIRNNDFNITSGSLAGFSAFTLTVPADLQKNLLDPNAQMTGSFTWTSGSASLVVNNLNVRSDSRIMIHPDSVEAGVVMRNLGFYVIPGTQSFTIATPGDALTTGTSTWRYTIE